MKLMMKRIRTLTVIGLTLILSMAIGCQRDENGPSTIQTDQPSAGRVALLMKARTNPFFDEMARGAENAAKENNVDLIVMAIDKETDTAGQAAQVETAISQGVQVILIAPADSKAIVAPLLQAQSHGIRIINLDNRIDAAAAQQANLKVEAFIGPDNREGARKSAEALFQAIGGKGKVAMLEGIRGVDNAENRKRGFLDAVKNTGDKISIAVMDTAEWATEPAQQKMEAILNTHPDLKGVFCANDMMALGAIQAIASAGKTGQVMVSGYDNLKPARQAIVAGTLVATVDQHPDLMGGKGVQAALSLIRGEAIPAEIAVPTDLVAKKDITNQ